MTIHHLDSHVHFMVYQPKEYDWVTEKLSSLKRNFLSTDLEPLLQSVGFEGCVVVEARLMLQENDWLLELSETSNFIKGVVGWVDLCSPNVFSLLEHYAAHPKFKGVRHNLIDEPDQRFMVRSDFQRGIAVLKEFDLTYDLLVFPQHLPIVIELVEKHPNQRFVVNHIALPNIKDKEMTPWNRDLTKLAQFENVFCKLSGMDFRANWQNWRVADFTPYLDVVFSAFGVERLMIGSNWPVCTVSGTYQSVMGIVLDYIQPFSPEVQEKILGTNCTNFYGL